MFHRLPTKPIKMVEECGLIWVPPAPLESGAGDGALEGTAVISYKISSAGLVTDSPYLLHTSLLLHLTCSLRRLGGIGCTGLIVPENVGEHLQSLRSIILKGEGRGDEVVLLMVSLVSLKQSPRPS